MAIQSVTRSAGLCTGTTWNSLSNLYALDGVYTSYGKYGTGTLETLSIKQFGFNLPTNATVLGVLVEVNRRCNTNGSYYAFDYSTRLLDDTATPSGTNIADTATHWNTSYSYVGIGGSTNLWGNTLTPSIVNSPEFGFSYAVRVISPDTTTYVYIDHVRMTIYYEVNSSPNAPTDLVPNTNAYRSRAAAQNFTFTYADAEEDACSAYRFNYKKTTDSVYTSSAWINNTTASGGTITHTVAANTFDIDSSYQWYVEVKDSAGAESEDSAVATFNTITTPSVTATAPASGIKKNANQTLTCEWTYSDPNSQAQTAYEVVYQRTSPTTGGEVSTGKLTSVNAYHVFAANALPSTSDPTYQWKVRVYDTEDNASAWSAWKTFEYRKPYATTGTFTSNVIETPRGMYVPATVTFDTTVPANTSAVVEMRTSEDNVTWTEWDDIASGLVYTAPHAYFQYRVTLTPTADLFTTSAFNSISLVYPAQYYDVGEWISPELDCADMVVLSAAMTKDEVLNHGAVAYATRCRGDASAAWSAWNSTLFEDLDAKMQLKITITRDDTSYRYQTPTVDDVVIDVVPNGKRSMWMSQIVDTSQAKTLASSKIVAVTLLNGGQVIIYSRSRTSVGDTWSDWSVALYDGTLTHPENYFIQLMVMLYGDAEIQELTLSLDGDAAVTVLKGGMTPGAEYSFATLNDLAIIVNGDDLPLQWDALSDPETLGTDPPILSIVTTHHNKAWGVDAEAPSRVRYSNILDPTKWDAYDFIDFNPDDGDKITSFIRYGQNLIVSKQRSMAMLTGNKSSNYSVSWLDSETGAVGKNGMCIADTYLVYVAQDGIRFTDLSQSVISTERLMTNWAGINKRRLNQAACVYWKNKCFIALPSVGSLHNDIVFVYDFLRNGWSIIEGWEVSCWKTFNQYGEEILLAGSSVTGQLYNVDVTYYDDTIPVEFEWRSKDFNFKLPEKYKLFRNIFVDIEGVSETTTLEVDLIVDGVVTGTYTTEIPAGAGVKTTRRILPPLYGAVLGAAIGLQVRGRCGIQSITIEYNVRGNIPGGDV